MCGVLCPTGDESLGVSRRARWRERERKGRRCADGPAAAAPPQARGKQGTASPRGTAAVGKPGRGKAAAKKVY